MKKFIATLLLIATLFTVAVPVAVSAASRVGNVQQIDASDTSVKLQWDTILTYNSYVIEISDTPNGEYVQKTAYASAPYNISGLNAGRTYYVRVSGSKSGKADATTTSETFTVATAPKKVDNFRQTNATKNSATFKWTASNGATSYKICRQLAGQEIVMATSTKTSATVKGLSNKKEISENFYIKPIKSTGTYDAGSDLPYYSCASIYSFNIMLAPKKPSAPEISSTWTSSGSVWLNTPSLPFKKGFKFNVYKADKKKTVYSGTDSHITGLKKGQFYKVKQRAYTTIGKKKVNGKWSDFTYFTLGCSKVNVTRHNNSIYTYWNKVKGGSVKYDIYVSKSYNSGIKKFKSNVKGTSVNVTKYGKSGLSRNTGYYVYILPKIKVGKKTYKSQVMSYVYCYTT